jgi:glyoxylase-like metal-dependent hydrolase (beta-lactamase superfamily II)
VLSELELDSLRIWALADGTFRPRPWYFAPDAASSREASRFEPGGDMEVLPIGCFAVEGVPRRTILVDAGLGTGRSRARSNDPSDDAVYGLLEGGLLPEQLSRAGIDPDAITDVVLTHLHSDHVGWLADPSFASNARVWVSRLDLAHFERLLRAPATRADVSEDEHRIARRGVDAVLERRAAGRVSYGDDGWVAPGVRLLPSPGHTPGHLAVAIGSGERGALLLGDAFTAPVQFAQPSWHSIGDVDVEQADRTRRRLVGELEQAGVVANGCHFPGLAWGTLDGRGRWAAID